MRSVADQIREEQRVAEQALTPSERMRRALATGRRSLEVFAYAEGLALPEARRALRRNAQFGRAPSACMQEP